MGIIEFADVIAFIALLLSFYNAFYSSRKYKELAKELVEKNTQFHFFTEYTRRYQDLIVRWPQSKSDSITESGTFYELYFDLCSEEYYLHEKGAISDEVWALWEQGMQDAMRNRQFQTAWKGRLGAYYTHDKFVHFINNMIR